MHMETEMLKTIFRVDVSFHHTIARTALQHTIG